MANVNLAVVYYSATGGNYQLAQWAEEGAKAAGAETKLLKVPELVPEQIIATNAGWKAHHDATKDIPTVTLLDIEWADAIIFSTPTRYGVMAAQLKGFLDTTGPLWAQGKLANKVVSAMTTASNPHGGQEATTLSLYTALMHWGAIIAAPGYTDPVIFAAGGNPYGVSATVDHGKLREDVRDAVLHQAKRTVQVAKWVKAGLGAQ